MKKRSPSTMRVLKTIHIIGAMLWTGGITCMLAVLLAATQQSSPEAIVSSLEIVRTFDYFVVIPGVTLCIVLGFIYGFFTHWGFTTYTWVLLKWILFLVACIPAALFFLPLLEGMQELVVQVGLAALTTQEYANNHLILVGMIIVQLILSIIMIVISIFKPFKKEKQVRPKRDQVVVGENP